MHSDQGISIWFFIGVMLAVYGVLICGSGIYSLIVPPPENAWQTFAARLQRLYSHWQPKPFAV